MSQEPNPELTDKLLHAPVAETPVDPRRPAYGVVGMVVVSLFILYHTIVLLQHTTPSGGLAQTFSRTLGEKLEAGGYMRATSNVQSWSMFAPNPHRSNMFLQVFVELTDGTVIDLEHDMYGRREYPYIFYDRMGKINRRLLEQERYQRHYAAWVCRDWALTHGGEMPDRVKYVKMWTKVPHPAKVIPTMGFDPMELKLTKEHLASVECSTTQHAQLPDEIRARYGLPPLPEKAFRDVVVQTWWDKKKVEEATIEKRRKAMPEEPSDAPAETPPPGQGAEGGG
ncbi:MAG: hypothetical protein JNL82_40210 [Myxococcales bacterium]|nr:hypothetical protein [Myxococcales bacterium]